MYDENELEEKEEKEFQKGCEMEQQSIKKLRTQGYKEFNADEYGCYYRKGKKVVIVLGGGKIKTLKQPSLKEELKWEKESVSGKCEICGRKSKQLKLFFVHLWTYGKRRRVQKYMCPTCIKLEKKGKL